MMLEDWRRRFPPPPQDAPQAKEQEGMSNALSRIHVEGFRSLCNVDLEPGRVTVLIGANGAGKSNLLAFLRMIPLIRSRSLRLFVGQSGGASSLLFYGPKVTNEISFRLSFENTALRHTYSAQLGFTAGDSLVFHHEEVARREHRESDPETVSLGSGHQESTLEELGRDAGRPAERTVSWWLARMGFFHFHDTSLTSALRTNSRAEDSRELHSDGSNLAAYLAALRWSRHEAERKAWRRINLLVRKVAPMIKELRPLAIGGPGSAEPEERENGAPAAGQSVRLHWIDDRDQIFDSHDLSDGSLRAIALITALAQPADSLPAFISIDEPELGLHPAALAILAGLIRSVSHRCQILLATQSSAFLDLFDPEDVVVAERREGRTELHRLEPEKLAAWP